MAQEYSFYRDRSEGVIFYTTDSAFSPRGAAVLVSRELLHTKKTAKLRAKTIADMDGYRVFDLNNGGGDEKR